MIPPRALVLAADRFVAMRIGRGLGDPDEAAGACHLVSVLFCHKNPNFRLLHLRGSRVRFPHRHADYREWRELDPNLYHVVAERGGWVVDLTRRQFDPQCPHPFIQRAAATRHEWRLISTREP